MTSQDVHVRVRWLDGRIETLDAMQSDVEPQEIQGLGQDLQWYAFRHSGEIDEDGFLIYVQGADPVSPTPPTSAEPVVLTAPCSHCGQGMEIHCDGTQGLGHMSYQSVVCPRCFQSTELPLPDDVAAVKKATDTELG
jgi:hypothetical protein